MAHHNKRSLPGQCGKRRAVRIERRKNYAVLVGVCAGVIDDHPNDVGHHNKITMYCPSAAHTAIVALLSR